MNYNSLSPEECIIKKQREVKKAFADIDEKLIRDGLLITEDRRVILDLPFNDLSQQLQEGKLKAVDVLHAFQAKALVETRKTNCISEFIADAEKWARERDSTPEGSRGILHGLPVSIKENFDVKGMETTLGLTKRLGTFLESNAVLVEVMLKQGAVPFVKTNVPQLIYSMGCSNPIYGVTKNPHDVERSPGGSSGGEAALIVGGGSVLGIGTDMMGSIRIPAHFCGTFGIKPTQRRISRKGCYGTFSNMIGVKNSSGFLGKNVDALAKGMESILSDDFMSVLDPVIPPLLWRKELYASEKKLTIGWYLQDDLLPVTPGIKRALKMSKEALEKRGHKVIDFQPPDMKEIMDFGLDILLSEGGGAMLKHWEGGEIVDDAVKFNKKVIAAPSFVKYTVQKYYSYTSTLLAKMASQDAAYSKDLWKAVERQKVYTDEFLNDWSSKKIDAIVGPGFPSPAPHPAHHGTLMPACMYFGYSNLCDMPTGIVPVTKENDVDQQELENYPEDDYVYKLIKQTTKGAVGLPLCVQVGALPWQEEILLYSMKELELGLQE